jgi:UDP-glucose 4-epimerase
VKDVVAANAHIAAGTAAGVHNVAYGGRITINDLARKIIALTGSDSDIVYLPERPGDVKHSMAAVDKLRSTGFEPAADFDAGLQDTIAFFAARQ